MKEIILILYIFLCFFFFLPKIQPHIFYLYFHLFKVKKYKKIRILMYK